MASYLRERPPVWYAIGLLPKSTYCASSELDLPLQYVGKTEPRLLTTGRENAATCKTVVVQTEATLVRWQSQVSFHKDLCAHVCGLCKFECEDQVILSRRGHTNRGAFEDRHQSETEQGCCCCCCCCCSEGGCPGRVSRYQASHKHLRTPCRSSIVTPYSV